MNELDEAIRRFQDHEAVAAFYGSREAYLHRMCEIALDSQNLHACHLVLCLSSRVQDSSNLEKAPVARV
jgi:hypothetical protein